MEPQTTGRVGQVARGVAAALAIIAIAVLPPWLLIAGIGNPWPDSGISLDRPLGTDAILGLLAVVVWIGWIQFVVCTLVEVVATVGSRQARRVPIAFGVQQDLARKLVVAVLAMLVTTSVVSTATAAAAAPTGGSPTGIAPAASETPQASEHDNEALVETATRSVTVERMDSLWSIAERELGEGERWTEIAELNDGRIMADGSTFGPDSVLGVGWELDVPVPTPTVGSSTDPAAQHVVAPGESLWQIAEDATGDGARYGELFDATRDHPQPGGGVLTDPRHIEPGWVVRLPADFAPLAPDVPTLDGDAAGHEPPADAEGLGSQPGASPRPTPVDELPQPPQRPEVAPPAATASGDGVDSIEFAHADDDGVAASAEITALRALLATATLLAAGAFAALITNRARQFRHRRPGRAIAPVEAGDGLVEHAVIDGGSEAAEVATWIDRALRGLGEECRRAGTAPPNVGAARLGEQDLTLHLIDRAATAPPNGWRVAADGSAWVLGRDQDPQVEWDERPAPYPALVAVGRDAQGDLWLLDAEATGGIDVICDGALSAARGDQQTCDVLRFLVAELALNAWAVGTRVHVPHELGRSVARINPDRVKLSDPVAVRAALAKARADEAESLDAMAMEPLAMRLASPDSAGPVVVVLGDVEDGDVRSASRTRAVVVDGSNDGRTRAADGRTRLSLISGGRGRIAPWDVELAEVFALGDEQAVGLGRLLTATSTTRDVAVPARVATSELAGAMRVDGSALNAVVRSAPLSADTSTDNVEYDERSLLPAAPTVYVERAATTADDVERLGATVDDEEAARILALDPTLDDDVEAWFDPESPRPKIQVFGPVVVHAKGEPVRNIGGTTEFLIYLACHENGVTAERAAVALEWSEATVHNRARDARTFLGPHPGGEDWLPDATRTPAARQRGVPIYQLHPGVLFSADLFRRLRLRAQAQGEAGIHSLETALRLVEGRPFDALRRRGYGWLFEGEPLQHHLTAAVTDCAHVIASRSIVSGDLTLARWACEVSLRADEHSDVPRLDLDAVAIAQSSRGRPTYQNCVSPSGEGEDPPFRTELVGQRASDG
ncbi:LysM peptidoglycan-binding domain-containing protein [Nocardioides zeae]|uniref:LysM peptidoglycan-binding domain-containing protein n=1 Tax=Nocardioides imazamoxiresistens TaxID=3231893 RepID=A0ABU3Q056_9ACTN|nr:LysM peptidoglycan-binding domain-containing protein [Nocardioides zeae]MDT9594887.1 LysM peptidoglycan-binding domain-containing protein [Nocardioides zeae]